MPDFAVRTAFTATEKISAAFNKMGASADRFGNRTVGAFSRASASAQNLFMRMKGLASLGLAAGVALIGKEFIGFDQAITSASAKFTDIDRSSKEGQQTLLDLGKTARKIGADTEFSSEKAANGINFLAMAGFNAKQSMALLPGVVDLATASESDFAQAADIASDSLGAFGLMTKDSIKLAENFTRVQDVLAKTTSSTNTDLETLFEAVKFGGADFTAAGQEMETFNAIAGRMAASGKKGSQAGTALRSMITRLQKPTKEVTKGLDLFGLTQADIIKDGKLMDMVQIMKLFEKGSKDLTLVQRNAALTMLAGKNAVTAWSSVMNEGVAETESLQKALFGAAGTSAEMAAIMRTSLLNQLKTLLSTVIELGFKFIEAFSDQGSNAIKTLTEAARSLGPVFKFMGWALSKILKVMPYVVGWFILYKGVLIAMQVIQMAQLAIGWIKYLWLMKAPIMAAVKAQGLLNLVMSLNPIGLVIAGIIALIGVGYLLFRLLGVIIDKWYDWGSALMLLLGPFGMIIAVIKSLYDNWQSIKEAFTSGGILAGIKAIGKAILSGLLTPIQTLLELISEIPGIGSLASAGAKKISSFRKSLFPKKEESVGVENRFGDLTKKSLSFGKDDGFESPNEGKFKAPNENFLKAQQVRLDGEININNAPEGSTAESKTTGSKNLVKLNMLGANP